MKKNYSWAKELLSKLCKAYPFEQLRVMAYILMGENIDLPQPQVAKVTGTMATSIIPREFKLQLAFSNHLAEAPGSIP